VNSEALARELVTVDELRTAARRHGLLSLDDAERVVLETGGTLTFVPKAETTRVRRHDEILARLDAIQAQVAALRAGAGGPDARRA